MKRAGRLSRLGICLLAIALLLPIVGCGGSEEEPEVTTTQHTEGIKAPCVEHSYAKTEEHEALPLHSGLILYTCTECGTTREETTPATKSIKVLAIGNSFSVDAMQYLWDICNSAGVENIVLGNLFIGGCTLDTHWTNISKKNAAYTYYKNTSGTWVTTQEYTVQAAIAEEEWDIITVQQASGFSGEASSYSNLDRILSFLEENKPAEKTKIMWHMTWAYQADSTHKDFSKYINSQPIMYKKIVDCVNEKIKVDDRFAGVIPSGTAIQNLRSSYVGDTVTRDGYHLSHSHGRYTAALTWYAVLTGGALESVKWMPASYKVALTADLAAILEAVSNALETPLAITKSKILVNTEETDTSDAAQFQALGLNIENYTLLDWQPTIHSYYNSTSSFGLYHSGNSTASNIPKFTSSCLLQKTQLPIGSVIIVDPGYQYRPEGWINESTLNASSARPKNVQASVVLVDEQWWGSYSYRAFNLSRTTSATMTEADSAHLRIYVPKEP